MSKMLQKERKFNGKLYKLVKKTKTKREAEDFVKKEMRGVFYRIVKVMDGYAIYEFMRKVTRRF